MSAEYVSKVNGKPIAASVAVPSSTLSTAIDGKVSKSGDTMSGRLTLQKTLSQVITGTGTAASSSSGKYYPAKWKYDLGVATPTAGDQMVIKLPVAGSDYGVYISTDNGTTYFPVARHTGASRLTTQYPNGAYVCVVFEAYVSGSSAAGQVNDIFPLAGGTARTNLTTGCWRVINDYDSGNTICQLRTENGRFYAGSTGCNPYSLVCLDKDNKYSMLVSSGSGTGTSKTINTTGKFKLAPVILYYSANNTTAANALVSSTYATFFVHQQIDTRYSHNYTTAFTTNSPLYIECSIDDDGYWSPTTKCITQTLAAGNYYIYLGQTYSTAYQVSLAPEHPVYYYDGTNLVDHTFFSEPMYDAKYARNDTAGDGWVRLAHTSSTPRQNTDVNAIWDVVYANASGGIYSEQLFLDVRYNSSGKGVLAQFKRRYIDDKTSSVKFAVKVTGVGGSGNTSVELWAFLHKSWNGLSIKQVSGNTYSLTKRNSTTWFYETYKGVGGTTKPVEEATNNIYVYDPTNETVPAGSFVPTTRKVNGHALSADVTVTAADVSAVRYDTNAQGLNDTQKSNARTNIGAGTSNLSLGTTSTTAAKGDHTHTTSIASDSSSGTVVTLAHDTQYKLTAGGTSVLFKTPADSNTDTKVTQTVDTSASNFPILAKNTTATATITDTSRFADGVTVTPSTKTINASYINAISDRAYTSYTGGIGKVTGDTRWMWVCRLKGVKSNTYNAVSLLLNNEFWNTQQANVFILNFAYGRNGGQGTTVSVSCDRVMLMNKNTDIEYKFLRNPSDTAADNTVDVYIRVSASGNSYGGWYAKVLNSDSQRITSIIEWKWKFNQTLPEGAEDIPLGGSVNFATNATNDSDGNAINATYFKSSGDVTLVSGTAKKIGTQNGTDVKLTLPTIPTVEASTTNGKIKINGTDTTVYTHPTQTAYSAKGSATKVPKITTDSTGHVTSIEEVTISGVAPASHTHGNIANGGTLTDTAAAAAGNDYVVIRDADNSKIQTSTIKGTDVADAVSKKHSHSTLTLSTTAQAYDGSHTLALPSTDPYTSARTPASHTHGNITNGGALQTNDITIANGDKLVVTDSSDSSKVARTSVSFDGSTTTTALTPKGTFESFAKAGDITTAIQALDVSAVGGDGKYISAISEADGKISATSTTMDTAPTASSTKAVTSGGIKTALDGKVNIANTSLEGQTTTLLSKVQAMGTAGTHYARYYTKTDGGSANISDKPESGSKGFVCEVICKRNNGASDYRYQLVCWVQGDNNPYVASVQTNSTSISWSRLNTNTDTKVTQTKDDSGTTAYPLLMAGATDPNGSATTSRYDSNVKLTPSTNTISANISGNAATASAAQSGSALETAINGKAPTSDGVYYVSGTTDYPAWVANHAYAVNDNAISGGKAYYCKTAHTSGSSFDSSKWTAIVTPVIKGTITGVTALYTGIKIALRWPITGGSSSTYLNINNLGNVYIRRNNGNITTHLPANSVSFLAYDGTYWQWADYDSNTTTMGAYCDTAEGTQDKVATSTSTVYTAGETFLIMFTKANSYNGKITLNINSQGKKDVWINGAVSSSSNKTLPAGEHWCHYDGSVFHIWTDGTAQFTKLNTSKLTTKADQYTDDGTTGGIDMQNSNIVGLNSIYTKDVSGDASEGIHFYRDATHTDTLWMAGGHMYFVPNRALAGSSASTTAANSNKVAILPTSLTNGYLLVTDGTDGNVAISNPATTQVGYSVSSGNATTCNGWKIVVGSLGQSTDTIYFVTT